MRKASKKMLLAIAGALLSVIAPTKEVFSEQVRVGAYRGVHSALIYLADDQGFFKKQGIDVILKEYEAGVLSANDLVADKVDIATASESVFVMQAFRNPDLRMPAAICKASDVDIIVRKDRGIERPQDLKGKHIAVTRGSSGEFFLHNYQLFNGIPDGSVHIVYQPLSEMVKSIEEGTIDAALAWPPYTTEMAKRLGANGARWPAQNGQDYYFAILAKEGFLKSRPKVMEKFMAALLNGEGFIAKYPDRAQALLRQRLGLDSASFLETWSRARLQLQLTQDMLVLMEREAKWAIRRGLVEAREVPNYLEFFHFDSLDKLKPEAVSVVH